MYKQSQYIIAPLKRSHIIRKGTGIDLYAISCQHFHNGFLQSVKVHFYINFKCLIGFCLIPVIVKQPT